MNICKILKLRTITKIVKIESNSQLNYSANVDDTGCELSQR